MPWTQKIPRNMTPRPTRMANFSLKDFSGGLNNRSEQLADNQASNLLNMLFADDTVMRKRYGSETHDALVLTSPVIFVDEYKPYNDANVLVRATATKVYFGTTLVATVVGKISGINYNGRYHFTDGVTMWSYGKFPTVVTTFVYVTGTVDTGYRLMHIMTPTAGFTPLGTTYTQGKLNIDFTNSLVWYEPCQNELADAYKGSNIVPTVKYLVGLKGRVFASGNNTNDDTVYIGDNNNGFYFPVANPVQLPPNSECVTCLSNFNDSIVVGRQSDVYVLSGVTNNPNLGFEPFSLKKLNTHTGIVAQQAVSHAHNHLIFLGSDGNAYALGNTTVSDATLVTQLLNKTVDLTATPLNLTYADYSGAVSVFFNDEWYLSIKDKVLVYNYRHMAWTMLDSLNITSLYKLPDKIIWGDSSGRTTRFSHSYLDYTVPYKAFWTSKLFDNGQANFYKFYKEFFVVSDTFRGFKSDVDIRFEIDYADVEQLATVNSAISLWGTSVWGDRFVDRDLVQSLPFIVNHRGRGIKFTIQNGYAPSGTVALYSTIDSFSGKKDYTVVYATDTGKYYQYLNKVWTALTAVQLSQPMKVFQINGEFEFRGKR